MQVLIFQYFSIFQIKRKTWKLISKCGSVFYFLLFSEEEIQIVGDAFSIRKSNKTTDSS